MLVNLRTVFVVLCAAAVLVRAADDPPAGSGSGSGNDPPAGSGTDNGGDDDGDEPPAAQPSSGANTGSNSRRSLQACEWTCPWRGSDDKELVEFEMGGTFTCKYADAVTCIYQKTTGVLSRNVGECPSGATALVAGCVPGYATNGGIDAVRKRKTRRTSREIQRDAMKKRRIL